MRINMANPSTVASQENFEDVKSFESVVSSALKLAGRDAKGKLKFPDDTPEEVKFAATSEQRRRDTQAEYTRTKQEQLALQAEKNELLKRVSNSVEVKLSDEQAEELDDLKFSDPDKWRHKMNVYENNAKAEQAKILGEQLKVISSKGAEEAEIEGRKQVLKEFQEDNPGFVITDEIIANEVPPRITLKLKNNEVTFNEFLIEVKNYLKAGKVLTVPDETLGQPNLGDAGGGSTPINISASNNNSYETEIY